MEHKDVVGGKKYGRTELFDGSWEVEHHIHICYSELTHLALLQPRLGEFLKKG